MKIEELVALSEELQALYEKEKKGYENGELDDFGRDLIDNELKDILKELKKVNSLIKIYKSEDQEYIVMKLERLYMMTLLDLDEPEFSKLSEDETFECFDKFFPDEWVYKYSNDKKEQLLLDAISQNRMIDVQKSKIKNTFENGGE